MPLLHVAVLVAVGWALAALTWSAVGAWRRPTPHAFAAPAGAAWTGIAYAFGRGMSPRAKESASLHPVVYATGMAMHFGVFAAVAALAGALGGIAWPTPVALALGLAMGGGGIAGLVLLARRGGDPLLRAISAPDDHASNVLVDAWLLSGALAVFTAAAPVFLVATIALAIYVPLGKIRHCVFFFLARGLYGARLGRRGIVGPAMHGGRS